MCEQTRSDAHSPTEMNLSINIISNFFESLDDSHISLQPEKKKHQSNDVDLLPYLSFIDRFRVKQDERRSMSFLTEQKSIYDVSRSSLQFSFQILHLN